MLELRYVDTDKDNRQINFLAHEPVWTPEHYCIKEAFAYGKPVHLLYQCDSGFKITVPINIGQVAFIEVPKARNELINKFFNL
jgi:hypothetical protein